MWKELNSGLWCQLTSKSMIALSCLICNSDCLGLLKRASLIWTISRLWASNCSPYPGIGKPHSMSSLETPERGHASFTQVHPGAWVFGAWCHPMIPNVQSSLPRRCLDTWNRLFTPTISPGSHQHTEVLEITKLEGTVNPWQVSPSFQNLSHAVERNMPR